MIFSIWQNFAESSHLLAEECGALLHEKATHTGTLDPMAEGVLVVLSGEDRLVKGLLKDWNKTYSFSILWGVTTDSGDRMGLIGNQNNKYFHPSEIHKIIANFPTHYEQTIPAFSARRFEGKSGFDVAKEKILLSEKTRIVEIRSFKTFNSYYISRKEILTQQNERVSKVLGNFRQEEILENWQNELEKSDKQFLITEHQVTTSPGTYIRQLVQDISVELNSVALTWSITRTTNGPFEKKDCLEIKELTNMTII